MFFGGALDGDVDAGGDDEVDVALLVEQRRGGPGDAAQAAVAVQPLILKGGGEALGAEALEVLDGGGDVGVGDELVPQIAADQGGEVVAGGGLAGAVEADDAAGGVEDGDQGVDGVEHGGDEVAFDGEGGLDALAGARDARPSGGSAWLSSMEVMAWRPSTLSDWVWKGVSRRVGASRTKSAPMRTPDWRDERRAGVEAEGAAGEGDSRWSEAGCWRVSGIS